MPLVPCPFLFLLVSYSQRCANGILRRARRAALQSNGRARVCAELAAGRLKCCSFTGYTRQLQERQKIAQHQVRALLRDIQACGAGARHPQLDAHLDNLMKCKHALAVHAHILSALAPPTGSWGNGTCHFDPSAVRNPQRGDTGTKAGLRGASLVRGGVTPMTKMERHAFHDPLVVSTTRVSSAPTSIPSGDTDVLPRPAQVASGAPCEGADRVTARDNAHVSLPSLSSASAEIESLPRSQGADLRQTLKRLSPEPASASPLSPASPVHEDSTTCNTGAEPVQLALSQLVEKLMAGSDDDDRSIDLQTIGLVDPPVGDADSDFD